MVCNLYTIWRWSNCFKILWNRNLWIQMFVYLDFNNNTSRQIRGVTPGSECSFGLLDFRMNANLGWRAWDSAGRLSITRVTIENHQSNNWCRKKTGCISISPQTTQTTINNNQQSTSIARVTSGAEKNGAISQFPLKQLLWQRIRRKKAATLFSDILYTLPNDLSPLRCACHFEKWPNVSTLYIEHEQNFFSNIGCITKVREGRCYRAASNYCLLYICKI